MTTESSVVGSSVTSVISKNWIGITVQQMFYNSASSNGNTIN